MADEPHYHSGGDSAAVKRKYEDSAPRRASGFSDGPPPSDSAPSYNNVPPPMDEIQIAKQKAQEIAARLFSSAEAKRPKFDNGGSGWDSNDNSGFSSGPNDYGSTAPSSVPSSYGYGNPSKKISIPQGRVGVIIGKAGETIKYLQLQSGAKIQVTRDMDADPHSLTREVELTGSEESIEKAEKLIKDVLAEAESGGSGTVNRRVGGPSGGAEQFSMQIPSRKVGLVIGKGGETIKNFQASTGARIQVIPLHPPPGDTSTERTVQIDGTSEQIEAAKQLVNEVISDNRQRTPMGGSYSQQGYQARPPGQQQQGGYYGYSQPGQYPGQQAQYTQQPYGGYPQQAASGYATGWDQSSGQQTTQGYDYYGQQQSQQTQPPGASGPPNTSSYGYGQQGQGYGQEGYGYGQQGQGYGQQPGYSNPTPGYNNNTSGQSQTTGGQNAGYGQGDNNTSQAPPTSAPQSGYSQPPGQNSSYPPQGSSQPGYGAPPTSQPEYGSQPSGYGGYGPPPTQKPPAYGQQPQQSPTAATAQTGYAQPSYGAPPPAYGGAAGYAQPPYGAVPPATQPGYGAAYGGSYGGGYQPPAYSADPAATAAPPTQAQPAPKASPQQN